MLLLPALAVLAASPAAAADDPNLVFTTLSDSPDPVVAGEQLTITILITNSAADPGALQDNDSTSTTLSVNLTGKPLTYVSDTMGSGSNSSCVYSAPTLTCALQTIVDDGGTADGVIVFDVASSATEGSSIDLSWVLANDESDVPAPGATSTTVDTEAELAVTASTTPTEVVPGQNLVYAVDIENNGPSDAANVGVTLGAVTGLPAPAFSGGCTATSGNPCAITSIAAGASVTVTMTIAVPQDFHLDHPATTTVAQTVTVTSDTPEPTPPGDRTEDFSTPVVPKTDLSVTHTSTATTATPGEIVFYTVTITNGGPSATDRVRLTAGPATVLRYLLSPVFVADEGIYSATTIAGVANWTGLDLDTGESAELQIGAWLDPAFVDPDSSGTDELATQMTVAAISPYVDTDSSDNTASHSDTTNRVADLDIAKDNGLTGVAPNQAVPYTIRVRNLGPSDAKQATVADSFDASRISTVTWVCSNSRPLTQVGDVLSDISTDGLSGARRGAVSFDGRHLYVAAEGDNGVAVYERDVDTGTLTLLEVERDAASLDGASSVVVSPDGQHVYATSRDDDSVVYFTRDDNPLSATFGELTRDGAVTSADLDGATDLAIAPDGRHVYAVATTAKKVVVFSRNPSTGVLTSASTVSDASGTPLDGVAAVLVTPDGRHVVVASADEDSLLLFNRNSTTGALTIADVETSATNLNGAGALATTRDGASIYVTGFAGNSLAVYDRKTDTDTLVFRDLEVDGVSSVEGLNQPRTVVVSPDGSTVYVAGEGADDTVAIFQRVQSGLDQGKVNFQATQGTVDPFGLAMSPAGEFLYVLSKNGSTLTVFAESAGAACDGGSGTTLTELVDVPAHSEVVFTATAVVSGSASGTLVNTATVTAPTTGNAVVDSDPAGTPDPVCTDAPASATNNSCSDSDPIVLLADLVTTKTTATTVAVPGGQIVYTLKVVNNGPNGVTGVTVADDLTNSDIASATWSCLPSPLASCGATPNGIGDISQQVTLQQTGYVEYTITVTLSASAAGVACVSPLSGTCVVNAASATLPAGYTDPSPSNASVSLQTQLAREADLVITKEVLTPDAGPGDALQFRITVKNCGPSNVIDAVVQDNFVSTYLGAGQTGNPSWTCTATPPNACPAPASGSGDINAQVDLVAGAAGTCAGAGEAVFLVSGEIESGTLESVLSNTATVSAPLGTTDPSTANNASTVSVILTEEADLAIVKDDGNTQVFAGEPIEYTIAVFNNGPENVVGASVTDIFPAALQNATWTCSSDTPPAGTLIKIEEEIDPLATPVYYLNGARAIAVDSGGGFVYMVSEISDSLSSFARDGASGELDFVEAAVEGVGGVTGLDGAYDLALLPNGEFLYVASPGSGKVAAFDANPNTGEVALLSGGTYAVAGAKGVGVSPDGEHVYVAADDRVAAFTREDLGTLFALQTLQQGVDSVDGLGGATSVAVSPDGEHVYVASATAGAVAVFRRNTDDQDLADFGKLTWLDELHDGEIQGALTVSRLAGADDVAVSPDGKFVYVAAGVDDSVSIFRRNTDTNDLTNFGKLTYTGARYEGDAGSGGAAVGLNGVRDVAISADGEHLYAAGSDSSRIAVFARNRVTGSLKFLESLTDGTTVACLPVPNSCILGNAGGAAGVAVSGDGRHVYLTGGADRAVIAFERGGAPPTFDFIGGHPVTPFGVASSPPLAVFDGAATGSAGGPGDPPTVVDGLAGASAVAASANNEHVFATGLGDQSLASFLSDSITGQITFVDFVRDGQGGIDGLEAPTGAAVRDDNVYVVSSSVTASENALTVFEFDGGGNLTQKQVIRQGGPVDGLFGASSVAVSPDGNSVYVASRYPGAIAVFDRAGDGTLTFKQVRKTGVGGVTNLGGAHGVAVSSDGAHVYATASVDDAVVVFQRDIGVNPATFGTLTQIQVQPNVGGLDRAIGIAVSREVDALGSRNVYVTGHTSDALVVYKRNVDDSSPDWGKLTLSQTFHDGVDGVDGLNGARAVAVGSDGKQVYVAGEDDDALAIFSREEVGGTLVFVEARTDGVGGVDGMDQAYSVAVVREGRQIYVAGLGDNAIAAFSRSSASRCTGAGVGNIEESVDIAAFGQVIFTVQATIDPGATGQLINTATVDIGDIDPGDVPHEPGLCNGNDPEPESGTNPDPTNDSCTDIDQIQQRSDLEVRKTDRTDVAVPGEELTYTLTVFNRGPSNIVGATVTDDLSGIFPDGATWTCVASPSGVLSFVEAYGEGDEVADVGPPPATVVLAGLDGATGVAFAPADPVTGAVSVYATGLASDALLVFNIDPGTGELTHVQTLTDGVGGIEGLDGAGAVVVSPDGAHVYVSGQIADTVVVFDRDETAGSTFGELSLHQILQDENSPNPIPAAVAVAGLDQPGGLALDADGGNLYVAAANSNAVTVFDRNENELDLGNFGSLTWLESRVDGVGGVDGLAGASDVVVSPDGFHVYATGENDDAIAVFERDPLTGALAEFRERKVDGAGADGMAGPRAVAISADGLNVYVAGTAENAIAVFVRNPAQGNGTLSFVQAARDGEDGFEGLAGVADLVVTSDDFHVYAAASGEDAVAGLRREITDSGRLEPVDVRRNGFGPVERLLGPVTVAASPDGRWILAAARVSDAINVFARPTDSSCNSGSGTLLSDTVNIAAGSQIVYTITGVVAADACPPPYPCTSTDLVNVASVTLPPGADDPDTSDNQGSDTDNLSARVDLEITKTDGHSTVKGLAGAAAVAVSPQGGHVYAVGGVGDGIVMFARDWDAGTETGTGELSYLGSLVDNTGGIDGLNGASWVTLSPNGRHVYVTGAADNALVAFTRDRDPVTQEFTGTLTFLEQERNGAGGVNGMLAPSGAAVSPDGRHVYVAGRGSSAIAIFARDAEPLSPTFGELEFVGEVPDGFDGVDGLGAVRALVLSAFGEHLYAVGESDGSVAAFARDAETGELTFLEAEFDGANGVTGLSGPRALSLSPDGKHLYVASFTSGAVVAFARDDDEGSGNFGKLSFVGSIADGVGGADGLAGAHGVYVVPDPPGGGGDPGGQHVYVAGSNDDALAVFSRNETTGALTYVGNTGLGGLPDVMALAVSPDAHHVYAAVAGDDAVAVFDRDWDGAAGTGELSLVQTEREGDGTVAPGSPITYDIVVINHGPSDVIGAYVEDIFPGQLENVTFTCEFTGGATCFGGSGDLEQSVNLPVGSTVTFHATGTLKPGITGTVVNTATVTAPNGVIELNQSSNSATDGDTVLSPVADIEVEKIACTDGDPAADCPGSATTELVPGTEVFFQIAVGNAGPSDAEGVHVVDILPEILTDASWTCAAEPVPGLLSSLATFFDGDAVAPTAPRCPLAPPPAPYTALDGLAGARAVALSPDGRNVYAGGQLDDGIAIFRRDLRNGSLTYVGRILDGGAAYGPACEAQGTVDGLNGLSDLVASPDGGHLYATGEDDDALAVFARDGAEGDLVYQQVLRDGVGANGLGNVLAVAISPDGKHLYTAAFSDNGVGVFQRNPGTGNVTYDSIKVDGGIEGALTIDGLAGASDVAVAPSGAHVYAVGATDGGVAVFSRNAGNGKLTYLGVKKDGVGGVDGLGGASGVALDGDGANVYVASATDGAVAVFSRNAGSGLLTFLEAFFDGVDGVDGLAGATAVEVSPDGEHVYVAGAADSAIAVFARDPATGRLQFLEAAPGLSGLGGVEAMAIPSDGEQVYAAGATDDALAMLRRQSGSRCTPAGFGDVDDFADIAAPPPAGGPGGSVVYTVRALLSPSAVGTLFNTAIASTAANVDDPDTGNNTSTAEIELTPEVDLTVEKTDGADEAIPGTEVTYTITITNAGPSDLVGATVLDDFVPELLDPVWTCSPSGVLEFIEKEQNGVDGVGGLDGGYSIAVNPDPDGPQGPLAGGQDVYVASRQSSAIAHFTRDALDDGRLAYVTSYVDGAGGIDGLGGAGSLALSPDGLHVYATGTLDNAVVVFERNPADGALTYLGAQYEGDPGLDGLEGAFGVAVSPDGENVYVTGEVDDTLVVFARNKQTGALTFVEREKDGFGGLELGVLDGVTALAVTPDGRHVVVVGPVHDKLVVFARDPDTGAVEYASEVQDGVGGVDGLDTVQGLVISPSGQFVYAAGLADDAIAIFDRDPVAGDLSYLGMVKNGVGGVAGLDGVRALELSPDGQFLYAAAYNSDALAIFARDGVTGMLTFLEAETDGQGGVDGLDGARAVVASPDGQNAYLVGEYDDAIAVFQRFGRGVCAPSGTGDIEDLISLAVGGRVTYTATATIEPCAVGSLINVADVVMPPGTDNLGDTTASDTDVLTPFADLAITKTNGVDEVVAGTPVVYSVEVSNAGPSCAQAALVTDVLPAELIGPTWTCEGADGGSCAASGSGDLSETVLVPPGGSVLFAIVGSLDPAATGTLTNTATVAPEAGVTDAELTNNSATDSDPILHVADLAIEKTADPDEVETGGDLTFTIIVTNLGPSVADGVTVTDFLPAGVVVVSASGVDWTCNFDATTVTCSMAVMAPGVAPEIVVEATAPETTGTLINVASVASTSIDPVAENDTDFAPFTVVPVAAPTVVRIDTVPDHGDPTVTLMETLRLEVTGLVVEFSEDVADPIGDSDPDDVTNPANFLLQEAGADGVFTTAVCGPALGDDVRVDFESVVYDPFDDEATLSLPVGTRLEEGLYQLLVCGSTTILDLTGNALDGNGDGTPGDDYVLYFRVQTENRLNRPYWDFASDLGAWTIDDVGQTVVDVSAPDADGFFLSDALSMRGSTGSATMAVSQCLPAPPLGSTDYVRARARIISASGSPTLRIEYRYFSGPSCTGSIVANGQSAGITGATGGSWVETNMVLPLPLPSVVSERVLFRSEEASSVAFEVQLDDLMVITPLFADSFETGSSTRWSTTVGGAP